MRKLWFVAALVLVSSSLYADFVNNNTSLPATKRDNKPIPPSVDPTTYWQASDYNSLAQAAYDLRTANNAGSLRGFTCVTTRPSLPMSTQFIWCDSTFSPPHAKFFNGTSDIDLSSSGGGVTSLTGGGGITVSAATGAITLGSSLGGDLSGNAGSATVTGLQGRSVSSTAPSSNQSVVWNGSAWAPAAIVNSIAAGTGASVSSATGNPSVSVNYGTSSTTACVGNDSRLPPTPANAGGMLYDNAGTSYAETAAGTSGQFMQSNGTSAPGWATVSVGLSLPASTFTVSGSPVTASGTLTGAFANQNVNTMFAGPSSGSATTPTWRSLTNADLPTPLKWFSPVDYANSGVVTAVFLSGNFSTGQLFNLTKTATITGARFYYPHGGTSRNVKVSLWDHTGTRVANTTVAVNAGGIYTATFSSSVAYSSTFRNWVIAMYETTGTEYYLIQNSQSPCYPGFCTNTNAGQITSYVTALWGPYELMLNPRIFVAGDAEPTGSPSSETYLIEPVYTVP